VDIQRALLIARRWWPLLLAGTLLAAVASYAVSKAQPRMYEATALLTENAGIGTVGGGQDFNEVQASWYKAAADAQRIQTSDVVQAAIKRVQAQLRDGRDGDVGIVLQNTKATAAPQSPNISLDIRARAAPDASLLANAAAAAFIARDKQTILGPLNANLAELQRQITFYAQDQVAAQQEYNRLTTTHPADWLRLSGVQLTRISSDQAQVPQLVQQANGIRLRESSLGSSVSVVQAAVTPGAPIPTRTLVNAIIAAVLALLVLLGIVTLIDLLDTRPRSGRDVAAALGVPLLGTIQHVSPGRSALAVLRDPVSPLADDYRALRAKLVGALTGDGTPRLLAVVGLRAGDGATTGAINLAAVAARAGARVVLVDANLRQPALHDLLDLSNQAGLATILRTGGDPTPLLQAGGLPTLRVLPAGPAPAEAVDLLGSTRMRGLLGLLREESDLVVVDAGLADRSDAAILTSLCDTTLLVARLDSAPRGCTEFVAAAGRLRGVGVRVDGVAVPLFTPTAARVTGAPAPHPALAPSPADADRPVRSGPRSAT